MSPELSSGLIGLGSGLVIVLAGKALDLLRSVRSRELDIATLVGELRTGVASIRTDVRETRAEVAKQSDRVDRLGVRIGELASAVDSERQQRERLELRIVGNGGHA